MATEAYTNNASTTLNGAINSAVTSVVVSSATGFPASGQYRILVDSEYMLVTGGQGTTTWTATRGAEGSTAASHSSLAAVTHILTAGAIDQVRADMHQSGASSGRPAAAKAGNLYFPTDGNSLSRDGGSSLSYWGPAYPITPPASNTFSTWFNQGSATETFAGTALCLACTNTNGDNIHGRYLSLPAAGAAYTYTACYTASFVPPAAFDAGMFLTDGAKIIFFTWTPGRFGVRKYTNGTTFSSDYLFIQGSNGGTTPFWMRIADNGAAAPGTNAVTFQYSADGMNWATALTRTRADFLTETGIGYFINPNTASVVNEMLTLYSWTGP